MNFSSFCALLSFFFFAKLLVVLRTFPLIFTLRPPLLASKIELGRALRHGNVKLKTDLPPSFLPSYYCTLSGTISFFLFLEKNIGGKEGSVAVACNTMD